MPQHSANPAALSLERKLPILIGGLVTCALVATLAIVQYELRSSSINAAGERLELVGAELGELLSANVAQRTALYDSVASDPAVVALASAEGNDLTAVRAALAALRTPQDGSLPIQLHSVTGRVLAGIGDVQTSDEITSAALPLRAERVTYGRMIATADGYRFSVSAPVRRDGHIVGHITQQRAGGRGTAVARFEELLGSRIELFVANIDGGDWAALDGESVTDAPAIARVGRPFSWEAPDGAEYFAHAELLAGTPWLLVAQMPMAAVTARVDEVLNRLASVGFLLLGLGLIAAWMVSRSVTRPLSELGAVADAIADGDYSRRVRFERRDEIGRLARSFDAMATRIDGTHAELQRRFGESQSLAGELELANARLQHAIRDAEAARSDAQKASSAKSQFLATMSHEIRTPINAIVGYTDLLDLRVAGPLTEQQQNYVQRVRLSSEHLISVVNDVLDFAKIESGQMGIAAEVKSVPAAIDSAVSILQARAAARRIEISVRSPLDAVFLGDGHRVQQILLNLLSNALKFTPEGGSVAIESDLRESRGCGDTGADSRTTWTCISVRDDGIGIAPDQIGPIFEPFVQGAGGYTRTHGGTGLGLAISRSLARMMNGDITVESELGMGSTFTIWLPHPGSTVAAARS